MKILAIDSTANTSTVAVLENDKLLSVYTANIKNTHSETLLPMVKSVLETLKLSIDDIDAFAASQGPGSFTGVRIGIATIKGLAFGKDKRCVGVSTIEALAQNLEGFCGIVCPIMNARRGQVYTGAFLNGKRILDDQCMLLCDLIPMLEAYDEPIYFVGDGYSLIEGMENGKFKHVPEALRYQSAYSVGKIAYEKLQKGEYTTDNDLRVEYLRKPQAEREREERLKNNE
ncbi:MAG: tRNA (adenosine(37)-N6)-threonylcarbamoyltransferase complex dimerization subunit type 1 TsaB [Ruminococcaceae bacterium]|nr:tRNA (adenosine(37)-N6)-threonylcarbamoyltransferase complex dimerization subunit type 1 TsaB [Oscillospiraceae bacterium]